MIRLYNTLGRELQAFQPIREGEVKLYTCGPTVYDYAQLGNLRSFVFDDTLRRVLAACGYTVKHVMNITDVGHLASDMDEGEDKLEKGAQREGKTVWDIAKLYTQAFKEDMAALNIMPPNGYAGPIGPYARATDFIDEQIAIVKLLVDKGFAYQTAQAIYFDVTKLPDYGVLAGQKLGEKETGARQDVVTDPDKHHSQDFALWFFRTGRFARHSMHWPSPWGDGFPGWHLECSAIIHATLGDPIDIHTGGVDHIGTHHPNEMAQTQAAFDHRLANYWLHNEFLLVDGRRMAKSLGSFYTLGNVIEKGYDPRALRLLFLQAHYRSQQNFTWEALDAAASRLQGLQAFADLRFQPNHRAPKQDNNYLAQQERVVLDELANDLATPAALAAIDNVISEVSGPGALHPDDAAALSHFLEFLDDTLGLALGGSTDIGDGQKTLITEREAARTAKDWVKSDELRRQLAEQGIKLNDTKLGPVWLRVP